MLGLQCGVVGGGGTPHPLLALLRTDPTSLGPGLAPPWASVSSKVK